MVNEAAQQGVKTWVCTTQPRNFGDPNQVQLQTATRDSILAIYGNKAIDFWNGLAHESGFILAEFNSGDGVHLNDQGHRLLFERVLEKQISDSLCNFTTVGLSETISDKSISIKVHPNPFHSNFQIVIESEYFGIFEMILYDIYGRKLYHSKSELPIAANQIFNINSQSFQNLSSQLLFLKIRIQEQEKIIEKIVPLLKTN